MIYIFALIIVGLMGMTLYSLLRGLNAFRQGLDAENDPAAGPSALQIEQNKMMWSRIKFQLAAIIVVAIMALTFKHN